MKRTLALLLPMVALILLLADGRAGADMWGPGSCFGGNSHDDQIKDAKDDTKDNDLAVRLRSSPSRKITLARSRSPARSGVGWTA